MTLEEFMRLPDDGNRYELVDGKLKVWPTGMAYEEIVANVLTHISTYARPREIGHAIGGNAGYLLPNGNVRVPDGSFIRLERFPDGKIPQGFGELAPDLAIEVIMPEDNPRDLGDKIGELLGWGVRLLWVVDRDACTVTVYRLLTDTQTLGPDGELSGEDVIPGFTVRVGDLFE